MMIKFFDAVLISDGSRGFPAKKKKKVNAKDLHVHVFILHCLWFVPCLAYLPRHMKLAEPAETWRQGCSDMYPHSVLAWGRMINLQVSIRDIRGILKIL